MSGLTRKEVARLLEEEVEALREKAPSLPLEELVNIYKTAQDARFLEALEQDELRDLLVLSRQCEAAWAEMESIVKNELSKRGEM